MQPYMPHSPLMRLLLVRVVDGSSRALCPMSAEHRLWDDPLMGREPGSSRLSWIPRQKVRLFLNPHSLTCILWVIASVKHHKWHLAAANCPMSYTKPYVTNVL